MMLGSAPLLTTEEDKLGLANLARHLAKSFEVLDNRNGYIFGIEGAWGSGKTSLANMALHELQIRHLEPVVIVRLSPWELSHDEDIISYFFEEMSKQITEYIDKFGKTFEAAKDDAESLAQDFRKFGRKLMPLGRIAAVAAEYGIPFAPAADGFMKIVAAMSEEQEKSFMQQKREMSEKIAKCNTKFFVLIDDLDRLEPKQIEQIVRLFRSVADFPSVTYILCYDKKVISSAIEKVLLVDDGARFLEKIVQFELSVPAPEDFTLRRLFRDRLAEVIGELGGKQVAECHLLIERWGGRYLSTPRSVDKVIDSIKFAMINEEIKLYISDLVLIKIIQEGNREYYKFIQQYLTAWSAIKISRGTVDQSERKKLFLEMKGILEGEDVDVSHELIWIDDYLPGIQTHRIGREDESPLLNSEVGIAEAGRLGRLSSPDHYRLYFASEYPSDAPSEKDIHAVLRAFRTRGGVKVAFARILRERDASALEAVLGRIRMNWSGWLDEKSGSRTFQALSEIADDNAIVGQVDGLFGQPRAWMEAKWFLEQFKPTQLTPGEVETVFRRGKAIGWLVSVARSETFSHGRYGNQKGGRSEWVFSDAQLDRALNGLNRRFKLMRLKDMLNIPFCNNAFFAWTQGGFADEAAAYIVRKTRKNAEFLNFLEGFWTGSGGSRKFINREGADGLFNYDAFLARVTKLSNRRDKVGLRAKALVPKFTSERKVDDDSP